MARRWLRGCARQFSGWAMSVWGPASPWPTMRERHDSDMLHLNFRIADVYLNDAKRDAG